jgi:RimJ/RimL family protein N-acetyltransferase
VGAALPDLRLSVATTFVLSRAGRLLRENDPDRSPAPHAYLCGCPGGSLSFFRADVPEAVADEVAELADTGRWPDTDAPPPFVGRALDLLKQTSAEVSLVYALPHDRGSQAGRFVDSGTAEGDALIERLRRDMPSHLSGAGFVSVGDFWPPWCVALDGGVIAAIAFAARINARGAAAGVYTFPTFRGRGLAAAVTARWSAHPDLAQRTLFYSTSVTNRSSRAVARRLGLRRIGRGLRIG